MHLKCACKKVLVNMYDVFHYKQFCSSGKKIQTKGLAQFYIYTIFTTLPS